MEEPLPLRQHQMIPHLLNWKFPGKKIVYATVCVCVCQTGDLSKNLHGRIFGPKILHTKSAYIAAIFTQKETA